MGRYGFGSIPELFHLTVNGFDPVILIFLGVALKSHHSPSTVIARLGLVFRRISVDVFNVLQFVHFKGCFIIRDHITYSDLIDAETEKRKVLRAGYHYLRYCWDIWRLSQIRQLFGSQLKCEIYS